MQEKNNPTSSPSSSASPLINDDNNHDDNNHSELKQLIELMQKAKGGVETINKNLIISNSSTKNLEARITSLEAKSLELDKLPLILDLLQKEATKREQLEKNLIKALKDIYTNNENVARTLKTQVKESSDKLSQSFTLRLWKLGEKNVFSIICILLIGLALYLTLLHIFF